MTLTLQAKAVYGEYKLYPHCDKSKLLAQLAGTKTITDTALRLIKQLGYQVEVLPPVSTYKYTMISED